MPERRAAWQAGLLRWHGPLLALGWLLNNLCWARVFGLPHIVGDSRHRYLPYAHGIAEGGTFAPGHNLRYVGYPLYLSAWLKLGGGPLGAVLGQLALSALAAWAFYDGLRRLTRRRAAAIGGTAALVLWPDTQEFNVFILTESLFSSGLVLTFWALVRARDSARWWLAAALLALLTASLRPNGFIVPLGLLLAGLASLRTRYGASRVNGWTVGALVVLLPAGWWLANKLLATFTLIETYQRGDLLYGYAPWALKPSGPLWLPAPDGAPALRLLAFAAHNPGFFLRLVGGKLVLFFAYARPYHSAGHIAAIVLLIWPLYALALRGARAAAVWAPARWLLAAVVLGQAAVVAFTVEDWDGRFLIVVLPAVFGLAALPSGVWASARTGELRSG